MRTPYEEVATLRRTVDGLREGVDDAERVIGALNVSVGELRLLLPPPRRTRSEAHPAVREGRLTTQRDKEASNGLHDQQPVHLPGASADRPAPEKARPLAARFSGLVEEARLEAKRSEEMRRQRETIRAEYEQALADSMLDSKKKTPASPLPDYDRAIEDAEHRSGAALRAASRLHGDLGDLLLAGREANLVEAESRLFADVDAALGAIESLRTVLDDLAEENALRLWLRNLGPTATGYASASPASTSFENGRGQIVSALRVLRAELTESAERREAVPA